jgi:hypothetical protein
MLLYLSRATYIFECKNLVYKVYFWVSYFRFWFLWPETKKLVIPFYMCIVYPHIRDFTNLAGYPPLKPKISCFVFTSLTTTYHWVWIVNSRKIARWCQDWRFQISLQRKIFLVPTLSLSPLCPRTSKRLSMGGR